MKRQSLTTTAPFLSVNRLSGMSTTGSPPYKRSSVSGSDPGPARRQQRGLHVLTSRAHAQRLPPALGSIQGGQALWRGRVTHGTNRLSQFTANYAVHCQLGQCHELQTRVCVTKDYLNVVYQATCDFPLARKKT